MQLLGRLALLSHLLHIGLIALLASLFVVYSRHYEWAAVMDINTFSTTYLPFLVTTTLQAFGTIYLAILVLLTQRLALRSDLRRGSQTLTALHDKSSAWLGLGSAVIGVWQQLKLRTAPVGILCIAAYLIGVFVLHISIPGLFDVVTFNATVPNTHQTTLANATLLFDLNEGFPKPMYDILLSYGQVPTLGLMDNMVYDLVPPVQQAVGNVTVNASIYNVQCYALPDASPVPPTAVSAAHTVLFHVDDIGTQAGFRPPFNQSDIIASGGSFTLDPKSQVAGCALKFPDSSCWQPIFMASTVPVVDSSGSFAPNTWTAMYPQMLVEDFGADPFAMVVFTGLELLACSVEINDMKMNISAQTRMPMSPIPQPASTLWQNWTWPQNVTLENIARQQMAQHVAELAPQSSHVETTTIDSLNRTNVSSVASAPIIAPVKDGSVLPTSLNVPNASVLEQYYDSLEGLSIDVTPSVFESFLLEDLGLSTGTRKNVTLAELNLSMGRALAALYWYSSTLNYSDTRVQNIFSESSLGLERLFAQQQGEATIMTSIQRTRLNLSLAPLVVSFTASIVLFALSIALIRGPRSPADGAASGPATAVDSAGILHVTWLLGKEPGLAQVEKPDTHALRVAGMFDLHLQERALRRVDSEAGSVYKESSSSYASRAATPAMSYMWEAQ